MLSTFLSILFSSSLYFGSDFTSESDIWLNLENFLSYSIIHILPSSHKILENKIFPIIHKNFKIPLFSTTSYRRNYPYKYIAPLLPKNGRDIRNTIWQKSVFFSASLVSSQVVGSLLSSSKFTKLIFGSGPFCRVATVECESTSMIWSMDYWSGKSVVRSTIFKSFV